MQRFRSCRRRWPDPELGPKEAWVVDYRDGDGVRRLKTFSGKAANKRAHDFEARAKVQVADGTHIADSASITVATAAEDWIGAVELGRNGRNPAEASTLRQYRTHIDHHIVPELGTLKLSKLTGPRVVAFRDHLLRTLSRPLAKKVLISFKSIIRHAQTIGNIVANPAAAVTIHDAGRHKSKLETPERDEIRAILAKLDELATQTNKQRAKAWRRYRALILTAVHTGMRASELRGLPWDAVNLKAGTIEIRQRADENGTIGAPKSTAGHRTINISAVLVKRLREWKAECPPGPLAFPNWQGEVEALANIHTRAWKPLQIAGGITRTGDQDRPQAKYRFHDLRHFRAAQLIADGANAKEIQVELGHATIAMVYDVYGGLFRDDQAEVERRNRAERIASSLV